jgi:hypothetical protein
MENTTPAFDATQIGVNYIIVINKSSWEITHNLGDTQLTPKQKNDVMVHFHNGFNSSIASSAPLCEGYCIRSTKISSNMRMFCIERIVTCM